MTRENFEKLRIYQSNIYMLENIADKDGKINSYFLDQLISNDNEFCNDIIELRNKYLDKYTKLFKEA